MKDKQITKHAGGRPTEYDKSIVLKVADYIGTCSREQTQLPTIEGFAEYLSVDSDTIGNWANAKDEKDNLLHPEFFGAIKMLKDKQKNQLMNDGLYGGKEVNAAMAIFLLKANHGMKEEPQILQQFNVGKDGNSITFVNFKKE